MLGSAVSEAATYCAAAVFRTDHGALVPERERGATVVELRAVF